MEKQGTCAAAAAAASLTLGTGTLVKYNLIHMQAACALARPRNLGRG